MPRQRKGLHPSHRERRARESLSYNAQAEGRRQAQPSCPKKYPSSFHPFKKPNSGWLVLPQNGEKRVLRKETRLAIAAFVAFDSLYPASSRWLVKSTTNERVKTTMALLRTAEQIEEQIRKNEEVILCAQTHHQRKFFLKRNKELHKWLEQTCEVCGLVCSPSPQYPQYLCPDCQAEMRRQLDEVC